METADLEVRYILVDKEFIIEAIHVLLEKWILANFFPLLMFILIWEILIFRKNPLREILQF